MPESLDLFAAELAFGLLDSSERLKALQLQLTDSEFAASVTEWEAIAATWVAELPDHPLSPELWDRFSAIIAPAQVPLPSVKRDIVARNPVFWRQLAMAASLMACLFAGLWISHEVAPPSSPSPQASTLNRFSVAQIGGVGGPHLAAVLYDRNAGTLTIRIAELAPDPARAPEIWLINGANPPRSLGFGQAGGAIRMKASAQLQRSLVGGATLAITLEPLASHPHTAPSSQIIGTGTISTL